MINTNIYITQFNEELTKIEDILELSNLEKKYTGKDSDLAKDLLNLKNATPEEKKILGKELNETRTKIFELIKLKTEEFKIKKINNELSEYDDLTFVKPTKKGRLNPFTVNRWEMEDIFEKLGFEIWYPYELDTYENIFEFVNIPKGHPAADVWDTFYAEDGHIPIAHTSSMQNRILKSYAKKIDDPTNTQDYFAAAVPGRTFRKEATDRRHEHTFNQIEGVVIGKGIKLTDMIGTLKEFCKNFFERDINVRVNPDCFPFVEPGNNIEISWDNPDENIMKITKGTGWLEVMGAGMIHPKVLEMAGINPEVYSGFAWGGGIERFIMIKLGIDDLRLFNSGDPRFLEQY